MYEPDARVQAVIAEALRARNDATEAACERMLTDPRGWGVLVHDHGLNNWWVDLSPLVPLYEVHTHMVADDGICRACLESEHD